MLKNLALITLLGICATFSLTSFAIAPVASLHVSVTGPTNCKFVSVPDLTFTNYDGSTSVDQTGNFTIQCSGGAQAQTTDADEGIYFSNNTRHIKIGTDEVAYGLYKTIGSTAQIWGTAAGGTALDTPVNDNLPHIFSYYGVLAAGGSSDLGYFDKVRLTLTYF